MDIKELHYNAPGTVTYLNAQKRVSWSAVWAGAFVIAASTMLLRSIGFAMGVTPAPPAGIVRDLSAGLAIWWLFSGPVCFYAGGWIAGRTNGIARVSESVIHGAIAWALASAALSFWPAMGALTTRASAGGGTWFYAFCIMCLEVAAACIGAAQGTRLLVASDVVSRETVATHHATTARPY